MAVDEIDWEAVRYDLGFLKHLIGGFLILGFAAFWMLESAGEIDYIPTLVEKVIVGIGAFILLLALYDRYTLDKQGGSS